MKIEIGSLIIHSIIQFIWIILLNDDYQTTFNFFNLIAVKLAVFGFLSCYSPKVAGFIATLITSVTYLLLIVDHRINQMMNAHIFDPMIINLILSPNFNAIEQDWGGLTLFHVVLYSIGFIGLTFGFVWGSNRIFERFFGGWYCKIKHSKIFCSTMIMLLIFQSFFILSSFQQLISPEDEIPSLDGSCYHNRAPPIMIDRPNIVMVTYDSGRSDFFSQNTFPEVFKWSQNQYKCNDFPNHYSGGVQSDAGHVSLMYGVIPTKRNMNLIDRGKVKSLPLEILKSNGYQIYGISAGSFKYCWALNRECEIHRRIFDRFESPPEDLGLVERELWAAKKAKEFLSGSHDGPYLLLVNFEASHYPYSYPDQFEKLTPVTSKQQINSFITTGLNSEDQKVGIKNRFQNSLLFTDHMIHQSILSKLTGNEIVVITSDHGEFLAEDGRLGHTIRDYRNEQTQVGLMICNHAVNFKIPTVTSHIDLLPSIIKPYLDGRDASTIQISLDHRFWFDDEEMAWSFSSYPWSQQVMLTDGNIKVITDGYRVDQVTKMNDHPIENSAQYSSQIKKLNEIWLRSSTTELPCSKKDPKTLMNIMWGEQMCLDRKMPSDGGLHVYRCWSDGLNQQWRWSDGGPIWTLIDNQTEFLGITGVGDVMSKPMYGNQLWKMSEEGMIQKIGTIYCLTVDPNSEDIIVQPCDPTNQRMKWRTIRI